MNKSVELDGVRPLTLQFLVAYPGQYKIEASISDANGNVVDSRSELITVSGEPPPLEDEGEGGEDADRFGANSEGNTAPAPVPETEKGKKRYPDWSKDRK
jgi:hypothetical protein